MPNGNGRPPEIAGAPWWMLPALGGLAMVIFAGALVASCFLENDTLRVQMFTAAAIGYGTVLGFFLGSSNGSQKKDETIKLNAAALATGAPTTTTITAPSTSSAEAATTTTTTQPSPEAKP